MIGSLVANYKILEKIGEGSMGAVFRAIDLMTDRQVAMKAMRPELARNAEMIERFRSEAVALAKLNHPNIATLFSFIRQIDDFFMVMEFVHGETLAAVIERSGPFQWRDAISVFGQILDAISYAHTEGIVHRDIKPSNVMLTEHGLVKVMDFGIAKVLRGVRITKEGALIGTPAYMSPEQILGQDIDSRSDIYSLGILLYETLTGRLPFVGGSEYEVMKSHVEREPPSPRNFMAEIPASVANSILRALNKDVEARFQTVDEFRGDLLRGIQLMTALRDTLELARKRAKWSRAKGPPISSNEWIGVPPSDSLERIIQDIQAFMPNTQIVFGSGDPSAKLMIIDQSPGLNELQERAPFQGPVGSLVTKMLEAINLSREQCYMTYAIKCRETPRGDYDDESYYVDSDDVPPEIAAKYLVYDERELSLGLREETPDERNAPLCEAFRPFLLREILAVNPSVILSFGGLATRTLLRSDEWIRDLRRKTHTLRLDGHEVLVVPTFRPGLLLLLPQKKKSFWKDIKLIRDCLALTRTSGK
jgi:serine/threonine protein kinase